MAIALPSFDPLIPILELSNRLVLQSSTVSFMRVAKMCPQVFVEPRGVVNPDTEQRTSMLHELCLLVHHGYFQVQGASIQMWQGPESAFRKPVSSLLNGGRTK